MLRAPTLLRSPKRLTAALGAGAVTIAAAITLTAGPAAAATVDCQFGQGAITADSLTSPVMAGVDITKPISVSCTGLIPSLASGYVIAQAGPGAALVPVSAAQSFANTADISFISSDGSGAANGTFTPWAQTLANGSTCAPTQSQANAGLTCTFAVAQVATQANVGSVAVIFSGQNTPAAPTLSTDHPSYPPGGTVTLSGSGFYGSPIGGTPAAASPPLPALPAPTLLLDGSPLGNALTTTPATWSNPAANTLSVGGDLGGSLTVPLANSIAAGTHHLTVIQADSTPYPGPAGSSAGTVTQSVAFTVGATTLTASAASGTPGTIVTLSGSNWLPGIPATASFTNVGSTTSSLTVNGSGQLSGTITPVGTDVGPIVVTQTDGATPPTVLTEQVAFTVSNVPLACTGVAGGAADPCTVGQVIHEQVNGTAKGLIVSQSNGPCTSVSNPNAVPDVHLDTTTLNGHEQFAKGCINTVNITDERGTLPGWDATGQLEKDFSGGLYGANAWDHTIPGSNLVWTPSQVLLADGGANLTPGNAGSGVPSEVTNGSPSALPVAAPDAGLMAPGTPYASAPDTSGLAQLCSAAQNGGGGSFECNASLKLAVPAWVSTGSYQAVLDVVVS
jgi:hypothetical protein